MIEQRDFWNNYYKKKIENKTPKYEEPFPLALELLPFIQNIKCKNILDLGCGICSDGIFFSKHGFEIYGLDLSSVAIAEAERFVHSYRLDNVHLFQKNISEPFIFENNYFGCVYSHLGLHYFNDSTTRKIFHEIERVLNEEGILAFNVKTINDFRYGEGELIGPDIYNYNGHIRHFFSKEYTLELLKEWNILKIEEYKNYYGESLVASSFIKVIATKR